MNIETIIFDSLGIIITGLFHAHCFGAASAVHDHTTIGSLETEWNW